MKAHRPEPCIYTPGDLPGDHRGDVPCASCGRPRVNAAHKLPAVPPGAQDHDLAVLGEHDIQEDQ